MPLDFEITDKSGVWLDLFEKKAEKVFRKVGKDAVSKARMNAPSKTGNYKKSITSTVTKKNKELSLQMGAKDFKANWIEYGTETQNMKPHHTIENAFNSATAELDKLLNDEANDIKDLC